MSPDPRKMPNPSTGKAPRSGHVAMIAILSLLTFIFILSGAYVATYVAWERYGKWKPTRPLLPPDDGPRTTTVNDRDWGEEATRAQWDEEWTVGGGPSESSKAPLPLSRGIYSESGDLTDASLINSPPTRSRGFGLSPFAGVNRRAAVEADAYSRDGSIEMDEYPRRTTRNSTEIITGRSDKGKRREL
jgi:hypothetical protein